MGLDRKPINELQTRAQGLCGHIKLESLEEYLLPTRHGRGDTLRYWTKH